MPYHDAKYPRDQRLLRAAPEMLNALRGAAARWDTWDEEDDPVLGAVIRSAIRSAEHGRTDDQ